MRYRFVSVLVVATLGCGMWVALPKAAMACDTGPGNHCYGYGYWSKSSTGATATINVDCLHAPTGDPGRFISSELWVLNRGSTDLYWTEEGLAFGNPSGFGDSSDDSFHLFWFWSDHRPGDPLHKINVHYPPDAGDNLNQDYKIGISQDDDTPSHWLVKQDGNILGTSTSQFSSNGDLLEAGSETSANTSNIQMHAKALQWRGNQGDWNNGWEDNNDHAQLTESPAGPSDYHDNWVTQFGHFTTNRNQAGC